jgi:hypothetical protein
MEVGLIGRRGGAVAARLRWRDLGEGAELPDRKTTEQEEKERYSILV